MPRSTAWTRRDWMSLVSRSLVNSMLFITFEAALSKGVLSLRRFLLSNRCGIILSAISACLVQRCCARCTFVRGEKALPVNQFEMTSRKRNELNAVNARSPQLHRIPSTYFVPRCFPQSRTFSFVWPLSGLMHSRCRSSSRSYNSRSDISAVLVNME